MDITRLAIGNILGFMASVLMVFAGCIKSKKKIIFWQTVEVILAGIGYFVLGSYVAAANMGIGSIRNVLCYKDRLTFVAKIVLAVLYAVLSFAFNNVGWIGIALLIGSVASLFIIDIKNVVLFKFLGMCGMFVWAVHDFSVQSYVAFIFDIGTIVALAVSMFQIKKTVKLKN